MNHIFFKNFLDAESREKVLAYVDTIDQHIVINNHHLSYLIDRINGSSYMYDISKSEISRKITEYQSGGQLVHEELPQVFHLIADKIAKALNIPNAHSFLQIVDMNSGGTINKHYDASFPGYVNYKCNISVMSEDYEFAVDSETIAVQETDMYCFEASLYKHWTVTTFTGRRVLLSFGFMVPYEILGRSVDDPRVRLSNRIEKYFQTIK